MDDDFLDELSTYVGFGAHHAAVLAEIKPLVEPAFASIVERFYAAIMANPHAMAVFTGGQPQIERQKTFLTAWLQGVMSGPYDAEYLRLRARIGRTHVRIRLDQRYVIGGMSIVREGLHAALDAATVGAARRPLAHEAIDKICDIELAIMVQTYAEDYAARIRDNERLATLGQLAGFIGHELRNPLAVMETSLHLLNKRLPEGSESLHHHSRKLGEQLNVCADIITSLLELARDRPLERGEVDVESAVTTALSDVTLSNDIQLTVQVAAGLPAARVDEKQLRQVIVNLVVNAGEALQQVDGAHQILVQVSAEHDALVLAVDDSGPGIAEELRPRLFEPLATTRPRGLGLGLALCRRIAEKHGGDIRALRSQLGGARFELRFPGAFEE